MFNSKLIFQKLKWWAAFHFHQMNSINTIQSISSRCANQHQIKAYLKRILLVNYYYYCRLFVPFRFEVRGVRCSVSGTKNNTLLQVKIEMTSGDFTSDRICFIWAIKQSNQINSWKLPIKFVSALFVFARVKMSIRQTNNISNHKLISDHTHTQRNIARQRNISKI